MRFAVKKSTLQNLCVYYLLTWLIAPPLEYGTVFRVLAVISALFWIVLMTPSKIKQHNNISRIYFLCSLAFGLAAYVFQIAFNKKTLFGSFVANITIYILILFGYIASQYFKHEKYIELVNFFHYILFIGCIFSLTTIFRSSAYETITRAAGGETSIAFNNLIKEAALHGVGGFGFVCFTSVLSPMLLYLIMNKMNKWYLLAFIILECEVFSAGYTIALLISLFGIFLVLAYKIKNRIIKIAFVITVILVLALWNVFVQELYKFLSNLAANTMYSNKVEDVFALLIGGSSENTMYNRQIRYQHSLKSIISYPFLGSYILAGFSDVGHHSSILDTIASYGVLLGFSWYYIIIGFPISCVRRIKNDKFIVFIIVTTMSLTALFNAYTMHMSVFYFICPAFAYLLKRISQDNNEINHMRR